MREQRLSQGVLIILDLSHTGVFDAMEKRQQLHSWHELKCRNVSGRPATGKETERPPKAHSGQALGSSMLNTIIFAV